MDSEKNNNNTTTNNNKQQYGLRGIDYIILTFLCAARNTLANEPPPSKSCSTW